MYLFHHLIGCGDNLMACCSVCSIQMLATTGDTGEPIAVPPFYSQYCPQYRKQVVLRQIWRSLMIWGGVSAVLSSRVSSAISFSQMMSRASPTGKQRLNIKTHHQFVSVHSLFRYHFGSVNVDKDYKIIYGCKFLRIKNPL